MIIKVLTVGKPDNANYQKLLAMYHDRLVHYTRIELDHIRPEKVIRDDPGIMLREESRLREKIGNRDYLVVMDKSGDTLSSTDLAEWLQKLQNQALPAMSFVIGGPLGFSREFVGSANRVLSFSPMTFPHELAAVMLLEQLYRAFSINKGEKYHK